MYANGRGTAKDEKQAEEYYLKAITADRNYALPYNELAWLYVTTADPKLHNAKKALDLAKMAVELSQKKNADFLDTLAHAFFELGDFTQAVETERQAAELAPKDEFIRKTLADYQASMDGQKVKN
jgi:tetratricopeptide (TPR) repeat protein